MLTLYAVPHSMYCAKVRICLRRKGVEWSELLPPGGYGSAQYKALIPAGNLPALVTEDGLIVADSEAINEFLEETYPLPGMLPGTPEERAKIRACSRFHDTRLEPAMHALYAHVTPSRRDQDVVALQTEQVNQRLAQMAQLFKPDPLIHGNTLTLADCGFPITFAILDAMAPALDLKLEWPKSIQKYRAGLEANEAVAAELTAYHPIISEWVQEALAR